MLVRSLLLGLVVVCACDAEPAETKVVLGPALPLSADTDEPPSHELFVWDESRGEKRSLGRRVRAAANGQNGAVFAVNERAELVRIDADGERRLLDGVVGRPAPRADGSVVVARDHGELGESDLWLVDDGGGARVLAPAPGGDDVPIALPDNRVAFVSGRTGIASLWTVNVETGELRQITNRHLRLGEPLVDFVPPPVIVKSASSEVIEYDAGDGEIWRVALR